MKELALPVLLVVFSLANAATIEINDGENEVIPRRIKEKKNYDTTQKSDKTADKTDIINSNIRYRIISNGSSGRIIPFKTNHLKIVDNGGLDRVIYFNTTGPLHSSRVLHNHSETEKTQSEEFLSAAKESDEKSKLPGKRSAVRESNEKYPERFESDANYHKDFESRTNPKEPEVKYILLQGERAEKSDSNVAGPKILIKHQDKLESNKRNPERFESDANYHKDFESRTNPKGLKPEVKYILLQGERAEKSDSNVAGPKILLKHQDKLESNERNPERFESDATYYKDFESRTNPKEPEVKYILLQGERAEKSDSNVAGPKILLKDQDKLESNDRNQERFELDATYYKDFESRTNPKEPEVKYILLQGERAEKSDSNVVGSDILLKHQDKLVSNERNPERFESDATYYKDFESRTNPKEPEVKYILLQGERAEKSNSNVEGSDILLKPHFKPSKNFPGVLNSNGKQSVKYEQNGTDLKTFGIKKKQPEKFNLDQSPESIVKVKYPPVIERHARPTYIKIMKPQKSDKSDISKWEEKLSDLIQTNVKPLRDFPLYYLNYLVNFDQKEKYQNLFKSKKPLLKGLESITIHPENAKPVIVRVFPITEKHPKDPNFVHANKHPFEFGPHRKFSEIDETRDEYFGASQEKKQEEKLKEFLGKFEPQEKLSDEIKSTGKHPESIVKLVLENKRQVLNPNKLKERDESTTIRNSDGLEAYKTYSREFKPQENYSSAVELQEKYPHRFQSTAKYPTFKLKGNYVNASMTIREKTSTKRGQILNFNGTKRRNVIGDNEVLISIPLHIKDLHKHDNNSSKQANALNVAKNIDIEVEIQLTLAVPSEKNKTYESKDKIRNEAYEYEYGNGKNSSEENYTPFHKTENRENKVNEKEASRQNEDITVNNGSGYMIPISVSSERRQGRYFHKSIRAAEPIWLLNLEKSSKTFRKRYLDSIIDGSSNENKSEISQKFNLRTKKSVPKHKPNSDTANKTNKETKQKGNHEITTEKISTLKADNEKTNVTTEETVKENVTLNAEAENTSIIHSGVIKQKSAKTNTSEAAKTGDAKYRHKQPSEQIEILTGDQKINFLMKLDLNDTTLKHVKELLKDTKNGMELKNQNDTTLKHLKELLKDAKMGIELKDQNETSTKPTKEVSEGSIDKKKKSTTTSAPRHDNSSTKKNKTDTSKSGEKTVKTIQYRQPNMMTTEVTIKENTTINNDTASTLQISNNTENISLNDGNTETKKSEDKNSTGSTLQISNNAENISLNDGKTETKKSVDKNSTVFREDSKTTNGSTPVIDKNNTEENATARQTTSNNSEVRLIRKSKDAAVDTVKETTTKNIHEQGAIKTEYTRSIDENSTAKIESFVWTGMDGLYSQTSKKDGNADGVNEGMRSKHQNSMVTSKEPTKDEDRNSDESTDEHVKNETEKQILKKGNGSELVGLAGSKSQNDETQSEQSGIPGENIDASHVNQSSKNTTEASNSPKEEKSRQNKEIKNEQEKVTGNNSKETVIDGEPKTTENKKLLGLPTSKKLLPVPLNFRGRRHLT